MLGEVTSQVTKSSVHEIWVTAARERGAKILMGSPHRSSKVR